MSSSHLMLFNVLVSFTFCEQHGNESHLWVQGHQKSWTGYLDLLLHITLVCTMSGGWAKSSPVGLPLPLPGAQNWQITYLGNSESITDTGLEGSPEAARKVWSLNKKWEMRNDLGKKKSQCPTTVFCFALSCFFFLYQWGEKMGSTAFFKGNWPAWILRAHGYDGEEYRARGQMALDPGSVVCFLWIRYPKLIPLPISYGCYEKELSWYMLGGQPGVWHTASTLCELIGCYHSFDDLLSHSCYTESSLRASARSDSTATVNFWVIPGTWETLLNCWIVPK